MINTLAFAWNFQDFLGYLERHKSEIHLEFVLVQILTNSSVHLSILDFTWHSHIEFN